MKFVTSSDNFTVPSGVFLYINRRDSSIGSTLHLLRKLNIDIGYKDTWRWNMHTRDKILSLLQTNKMKIQKYGVKRIGLFGSYARGEQVLKSDIDILVEFKKGLKNFDNYMDLKFYLEELFGYKVDLVINDSIKPSLREPILSGVTYAA